MLLLLMARDLVRSIQVVIFENISERIERKKERKAWSVSHKLSMLPTCHAQIKSPGPTVILSAFSRKQQKMICKNIIINVLKLGTGLCVTPNQSKALWSTSHIYYPSYVILKYPGQWDHLLPHIQISSH